MLSILAQVDQYLGKVEALINTRSSAFRNIRDDLDDAERVGLSTFTHELRAGLLDIKRSLGLQNPRAAESARWVIRTNLEFAVVELLELTQTKLSGYGAVDAQAFAELDQKTHAARAQLEARIAEIPPPGGQREPQ
ncbi:MAG: hypothetical protein ACRETQ_11160 [Gammaproteobacteria bacterium]